MKTIVLCLLLVWSSAADRCVLFLTHSAAGRAALFDELSLRSDPASDHYLVWLSRDDVAAILQPNASHVEAAVALTHRHSALSVSWVGSDKLEVPGGRTSSGEEGK